MDFLAIVPSPCWIVCLEDFEIVALNESAARIFHYCQPELVGRKLSDVVAPESMKDALSRSMVGITKITYMNKKGSRFTLRINVATTHWKGVPLRAVTVLAPLSIAN
jgi:PAS domain S-box-containing protein